MKNSCGISFLVHLIGMKKKKFDEILGEEMADKVEVVIKIPKYYLTHPQDYSCLAECVRRGTPLPKGHGRLGDLDALRKEISSWGMNDYEPSDFIDEIDKTNTIIEREIEE